MEPAAEGIERAVAIPESDPEAARLCYIVIIQHLLELLMIQSDKLAYLTDLSGSRGRTSGVTALSAHSEEHEVF